MNKPDFDLLKRILLDTTLGFQNGTLRHSNADEWFEIAEELQRAVTLANDEGNRLFEDENR